MAIDYKKVYQEFDAVRHLQEYGEYVSEMDEIARIFRTTPFDSNRAAQLCSLLANKYETEINQHPPEMGLKRTVVKRRDLPQKTVFDLMSDLRFFQTHIPVFALKRELKSEIKKALLGL